MRFISVAENIDTAKGTDGLVLPFTNVINSFYARQVSAKTKAAFVARAKDGQRKEYLTSTKSSTSFMS